MGSKQRNKRSEWTDFYRRAEVMVMWAWLEVVERARWRQIEVLLEVARTGFLVSWEGEEEGHKDSDFWDLGWNN